MPDLAAGLLVLATAVLAFAWERLRRWERRWMLGAVLLAASFHSSHLLLGLGLAGLATLLTGHGHRCVAALRLGLPLVLAVAALTAVGWLGFGRPTPTPQSPPFLLARSWEDGPARAYLARACGVEGQPRWTICPLVGTLAPSAQEFLWGEEHSYWAMDLATRAAVRAEEGDVLRRAILAHPLLQLGASLRNAGTQMIRFGLDDFVLGRGALVTPEDYTFVYLPIAPAAAWGLDGFTALTHVGTLASLGVLAVAWRGIPARHRRVVLLALAGLALNAVVCGALSGPHDRYQARVVWLLPLLAAAVALRGRRAGPSLSSATPPAPASGAP
jgi:hypothetical protein